VQALTLLEVEYVAFRLAREMLVFNEPIPDFHTRFPNQLESCLVVPFSTFSGKSLYSGFLDKAAILFYLLIKNHPFQNGNKRIAMTTLLVFLYKNGKWLKADAQELYNFTMWITQSPPPLKDEVILAVKKFLKTHLAAG